MSNLGFEIKNLSNGKAIYISKKKASVHLSERIRFRLDELTEEELTGYSSDSNQIGGP